MLQHFAVQYFTSSQFRILLVSLKFYRFQVQLFTSSFFNLRKSIVQHFIGKIFTSSQFNILLVSLTHTGSRSNIFSVPSTQVCGSAFYCEKFYQFFVQHFTRFFNILPALSSIFYKFQVQHFTNLWFNLCKFKVHAEYQMLEQGSQYHNGHFVSTIFL